IISAGHVMPEFMTAEYRENRRAVRPAADKPRAADCEKKEERVKPASVLKLGPRLPDGSGIHLPDILQAFTRLETNGAARRAANFFACPWVAAAAARARLHLKHADPAQLDAFAALHGGPHRVEDGVDRHLGLDPGDVGNLRHFLYDVDLDHALR